MLEHLRAERILLMDRKGMDMKQSGAIQTGARTKVFRKLRLTGLAGLTYASLVFISGAFTSGGMVMAEPSPAARVDVFAQHSGGKIAYHYRVFNKSQQDIAAVSVGLDSKNDENPNNDIHELYELPSGWNVKFGIPTTSSNSPTGWRVSVTNPEKSDTHAITWEPLNENSPRLLAGQTLAKMSVSVDKADSNYLTGHARVTYTKGNPATLTVPLERLDNTPPSLTVNLNPNLLRTPDNQAVSPDPSRRAIPVKATFTVKDNYDRMPEIKLVSITASEPLQPDDIRDASLGADDRYLLLRAAKNGNADRIYTVTYSATDASGNQTTASATVTVTSSTMVPVTTPVAASAPVSTP